MYTRGGPFLEHIWPCRVYFLDVPLDTVLERLALRRVDPVTGERYRVTALVGWWRASSNDTFQCLLVWSQWTRCSAILLLRSYSQFVRLYASIEKHDNFGGQRSHLSRDCGACHLIMVQIVLYRKLCYSAGTTYCLTLPQTRRPRIG